VYELPGQKEPKILDRYITICLSPILFNLYSEYLTKEALEGLRDFKIGGQIIHTVKYADDLVLLAKEEKCYRT
jgi:hypothetical protein